MNQPRLISLTGLLVTSALALGACGDDGLSKAEYVKQANAVCRDANAQLGKIAEPSDVAGLATYVSKAKNVTSEAIDEMAGLEPPEALQADHEAHLAAGRKVIGLANDLGRAASAGDEAELQRLSEMGDRLDEQSDARATRMGLTDCAEDAS